MDADVAGGPERNNGVVGSSLAGLPVQGRDERKGGSSGKEPQVSQSGGLRDGDVERHRGGGRRNAALVCDDEGAVRVGSQRRPAVGTDWVARVGYAAGREREEVRRGRNPISEKRRAKGAGKAVAEDDEVAIEAARLRPHDRRRERDSERERPSGGA